MKPEGGMKGRLTMVHEVGEEQEGKIKEWVKEDEIGQMGDASNKL